MAATIASPERVARAYDRLADGYDGQVAAARWIRERVWERLDALIPAGSVVADVTAGTGLDAAHLAARGVRVIACDISAGMLSRLHERAPDVETRLADFNRLDLGREVDAIISTFAGLNTAPDLQEFAAVAARHLRPGGLLYIHVLNRWALVDIGRRAAGGQLRGLLASRRAVRLGDLPVTHRLYSPDSLYRAVFARGFGLLGVEGQALFPGGARLGAVERRLARRRPFNGLGTFFALELVRR